MRLGCDPWNRNPLDRRAQRPCPLLLCGSRCCWQTQHRSPTASFTSWAADSRSSGHALSRLVWRSGSRFHGTAPTLRTYGDSTYSTRTGTLFRCVNSRWLSTAASKQDALQASSRAPPFRCRWLSHSRRCPSSPARVTHGNLPSTAQPKSIGDRASTFAPGCPASHQCRLQLQEHCPRASDAQSWIGPSVILRALASRPVPREMISAVIEIAVSSGVRAPMSSPIGE